MGLLSCRLYGVEVQAHEEDLQRTRNSQKNPMQKRPVKEACYAKEACQRGLLALHTCLGSAGKAGNEGISSATLCASTLPLTCTQ